MLHQLLEAVGLAKGPCQQGVLEVFLLSWPEQSQSSSPGSSPGNIPLAVADAALAISKCLAFHCAIILTFDWANLPQVNLETPGEGKSSPFQVKALVNKSDYQKKGSKWRRKYANIQSMDIASLNSHVKENITVKTAGKIKTCPKTHLKSCKGYASESCKFKNECAYSHQDNPKINKTCEHTNAIDILEKIVRNIYFRIHQS